MQIPFLDLNVHLALMKSIPYMRVTSKIKDPSTWLQCSEKYFRRVRQEANLPFHLYHVLEASQVTQFMFVSLNVFLKKS